MGVLRAFLRKPAQATGTPLNIHMFSPAALQRNTRTLIRDPRYFVARIRTMAHQALHPNDPWLTAESIKLIRRYLTSDMRGFEWGSGRSTIYFARILRQFVSVEHHPDWFQLVRKQLEGRRLRNVEYHFVDMTRDRESYHQVIARYPDDHFNLILVDGEDRAACLRAAIPKLRSGGYLVLDNSEEVGDTSSCAQLDRIDTDNGVWHTALFVKAQ